MKDTNNKRNRLTNIIRTSKRMHFSQELESAEGDLKIHVESDQ